VLTSINMSIVNTSIASSFGPNVLALDGDDSKKTGEELQFTDLLVVPLRLCSFVSCPSIV
jgi:hypothetical protein